MAPFVNFGLKELITYQKLCRSISFDVQNGTIHRKVFYWPNLTLVLFRSILDLTETLPHAFCFCICNKNTLRTVSEKKINQFLGSYCKILIPCTKVYTYNVPGRKCSDSTNLITDDCRPPKTHLAVGKITLEGRMLLITTLIYFNSISELLFACHLLGLCKSDDIELIQVKYCQFKRNALIIVI